MIAVELHPRRVAELRARYDRGQVTVVRADVTQLRLPRRPFHVVSNPPWSIAESVRASLSRSQWLVRADLVLPRWLVRRWAEEDARIAVGCSIRAEHFTPPAPTGAAVAVVSGPSSREKERVQWSR